MVSEGVLAKDAGEAQSLSVRECADGRTLVAVAQVATELVAGGATYAAPAGAAACTVVVWGLDAAHTQMGVAGVVPVNHVAGYTAAAASAALASDTTLVVAMPNAGADDAVVYDGGGTCRVAGAAATLLATYDIASARVLAFRCAGNTMRRALAPLAQPLARGKVLLVAGFLRQPYATPLATAWRATDTAAPTVETPFAAVADDAALVLEDVRALHRVPGREPDAAAVPRGFARTANGTYAVLLGAGADTFVATFDLQHCTDGVLHRGTCLCTSGRESAPGVCAPDTVPASGSASEGSSRAGSGSSHGSGRVVIGSDSEDTAFFGSLLAVIVFGATAAVFLVLAVVFISLFAAKRHRRSSGSHSTEME